MGAYLYSSFDDTKTLKQQLQQWRENSPDAGVLALVAERDGKQIPQLQALCRESGMPLMGGVFPALHLNGRNYQQGVLLILLDPMADYHCLIEFGEDSDATMSEIEAIAAQIKGRLADDQEATLLMFFDALVLNIGTILEALYLQLAEAVHYTGANTGSERFKPIPCLFDSERLIRNGLILLLLKQHEGAVLEHGYRVPEKLIAATSTEGNRIISIGWKPAFDVYRDHIKLLHGIEITHDNFLDYAVHFPFGILRADDELLVRIPVALEQDGSLFCAGEVPEHGVLALLEAPQEAALNTADLLAARLGQCRGPVLTFYCAGRWQHLGAEKADDELARLQLALDSPPLLGALSLGEIGSSQRGGYPLFHHACLVCMKL
jgi:hypothetical protein